MKPKRNCIHRCGDGVGCPYCLAFDRAIEDERTCNEYCEEYDDDGGDDSNITT